MLSLSWKIISSLQINQVSDWRKPWSNIPRNDENCFLLIVHRPTSTHHFHGGNNVPVLLGKECSCRFHDDIHRIYWTIPGSWIHAEPYGPSPSVFKCHLRYFQYYRNNAGNSGASHCWSDDATGEWTSWGNERFKIHLTFRFRMTVFCICMLWIFIQHLAWHRQTEAAGTPACPSKHTSTTTNFISEATSTGCISSQSN